MTVYYLDFEDGNDSNSGQSFSNRWKTFTGITAGDMVAGDELRVMASPSPTSLGINATWTSGVVQATKSIVSSTNASPIAMTVTSHGFSTGDVLTITGHNSNTNANGIWQITVTGDNTFTLDGSTGNGTGAATGTVRLINNAVVRLASPLTAMIAVCNAAWTAANSATSTFDANCKYGQYATRVTLPSSPTTGRKYGYYDLGGVTDLSAYRQLSLWIMASAAIATGNFKLCLCSDTTGDVIVDTFQIPPNAGGQAWMPVALSRVGGGALGNSIQSIALYSDTVTPSASIYVNLDCIIACKDPTAADSLTLCSLIGKPNSTGAGGSDSETWYGIQSINGALVVLDNHTGCKPSEVRGYYGTSETVTGYKRETAKVTPSANTYTANQTLIIAGTATAPITVSFGWDRVAMTSQNSQTWLDGQNGNGSTVTCSVGYYSLTGFLGIVRGYISFDWRGYSGNHSGFTCHTNNSTAYGTDIRYCGNNTWGTFVCCNNLIFGLRLAEGMSRTKIAKITSKSNGNVNTGSTHGGLGLSGIMESCTIDELEAYNNNNSAVCLQYGSAVAYIAKATTDGNTRVATNNRGGCIINDLSSTEPTIFLTAQGQSSNQSGDGMVVLPNFQRTANDHRVYYDTGLVQSVADDGSGYRHTHSGLAWLIQPTSAVRNVINPLCFPIAQVLCIANQQVTVSAWIKKSTADASFEAAIACRGRQIAGVADDVQSSLAADSTDWQQLSILFTPTIAGLVTIEARVWGGTTYAAAVDDVAISGHQSDSLLGMDYLGKGLPFVLNNTGAAPGGGAGCVIGCDFIQGV